ncbi:MAG: hypothetical protein R2864_07840 [Syntrophotaleaceae bacterium]
MPQGAVAGQKPARSCCRPNPTSKLCFTEDRHRSRHSRQQLFPGGVEVPYEGLSFGEQLARTQQLVERGAEVIYRGVLFLLHIFVKVDILVRDGTGRSTR